MNRFTFRLFKNLRFKPLLNYNNHFKSPNRFKYLLINSSPFLLIQFFGNNEKNLKIPPTIETVENNVSYVELLIEKIEDDPSLKGEIVYYIDYILSMIENIPNNEIERSPSYITHIIFYFISFLKENKLINKCLDCYDVQFKILEKINAYDNYPDIVLDTYDHYGNFFLDEKDFSNAIKYFKEYISFSKLIKSKIDETDKLNLYYDLSIAKGYGYLSVTYLYQYKQSLFNQNIEKMKQIIDKILVESKESFNDDLLYQLIYFNIDIYSQISMIYYDRNKMNESKKYLEDAYQLCMDYHKSINDDEKKNDVLELSKRLLRNIQSVSSN